MFNSYNNKTFNSTLKFPINNNNSPPKHWKNPKLRLKTTTTTDIIINNNNNNKDLKNNTVTKIKGSFHSERKKPILCIRNPPHHYSSVKLTIHNSWRQDGLPKPRNPVWGGRVTVIAGGGWGGRHKSWRFAYITEAISKPRMELRSAKPSSPEMGCVRACKSVFVRACACHARLLKKNTFINRTIRVAFRKKHVYAWPSIPLLNLRVHAFRRTCLCIAQI